MRIRKGDMPYSAPQVCLRRYRELKLEVLAMRKVLTRNHDLVSHFLFCSSCGGCVAAKLLNIGSSGVGGGRRTRLNGQVSDGSIRYYRFGCVCVCCVSAVEKICWGGGGSYSSQSALTAMRCGTSRSLFALQ